MARPIPAAIGPSFSNLENHEVIHAGPFHIEQHPVYHSEYNTKKEQNTLLQLSCALDAPIFPSAPARAVGIFWRVVDHLVIDYSLLGEAEEYGDCLTHATGHYDRWQKWQALGAKGLNEGGYPGSILFTEYDEWPRGRVVYERSADRFVIYADRQLQDPEIVGVLKTIFGLNGADMIIKGDLHYRSPPIRK
jgi:hypothetical protein